jgi:MFS family permease
LALVAFVFVERRAVEPVLPLHLFSNRGFSVTSVVGFIVGFAMFGAITYLPVFFQIVHGESPTVSGLQLLPLLVGLIIFSTGSGLVISRTGRYRAFPIAGTGLITIGILLLSQVGVGTSLIVAALFMFVLGVGLGCVMQVLVLIVQNAVPYGELGVATSGATFFRSIGGSFGTAIFGAIFSNVLVGNLAKHLGKARLPSGLASSSVTPAILDKLPHAVHHAVSAAYAESIQTVFIIAAPIGAVAFLASWLIPQVELRRAVDTAQAAAIAEPA